MQLLILALLSLLCSFGLAEEQQMLNLNGAMATRTFDGIGGLSGGGATSRLLVDYPEPQKSQILDYLFLPNFGASLHILKVEIGGDCQTTDGTEPSHMHTRDDQNYERGYEWWLMVEAKKRNPNIKLYALSWGVPGWIGNGNYFSNDNVMYQVNWIKGAKRVYGLDIDYIGIWNERSFTDDRNCTYIKNLRAGLDAAGFTNTKIVAADGDWSIVGYLQNDADLRKAVHTVGVHYPGTTSPEDAKKLYEQYGIPLWASEDYSTYSNNVGDGCWSRILNQNWVNGYMTGTISWNLIAAYYPSLPFGGDGLSWAWYPWSGNYDITGTVWGSAHITQFAYPGWKYLGHGYGSGHLPKGGSYVTLVPPEEKGDFSLIIETMTHDNSICIRPDLPPYTVENQTVTFNLMHLNQRGPLHAWYTHFSAKGDEVVYFKQLPDIHPVNGQFSVTLDLDSIVTITTTTGQKKGSYPTPPAPSPFPLPYSDNFESYVVSSEARYFADQTGVWEINQGPKGKTMKQMVPAPPITWCGEAQSPITFIGSNSLSSVLVELDAWVVGGQINVGCRASNGGCTDNYGTGYFLWVGDDGKWSVYAGSSKQLGSGTLPWPKNTFNRLSLSCNQDTITAKFNNKILGSFTDSTHQSGFVSVGSSWQGDVQFDNFNISGVPANCGQGNHVNVAPCGGQNAITWVINSDGSIRPRNDNNLCLDLKGTNPKTGAPAAVVSPCDVASNPNQVWSWSESSKTIINKFSGKCLDIASQDTAPCATVEVWDCNSGTNQAWAYNEKTGVIITFLDGGCLGIGAA